MTIIEANKMVEVFGHEPIIDSALSDGQFTLALFLMHKNAENIYIKYHKEYT